MKTRVLFGACALLAGILLSASGCSKAAETSKAPPAKKTTPKSNMQTTVEGLTGKTAVDAGKKAEEKLNAINAQREEDIKELDSF